MIAEEHDAGGHGVAHRVHALDVLHRIAADLDLDAAVAGVHVGRGAARHRPGRVLRDRAVEIDALSEATAEVGAERHARRLRGEVVHRHVERGLDVGLAEHRVIERTPDTAWLARVEAEQHRCQLGHAGARARRERGRVERAQRRHLADSHESLVARQHDDRGVGAVLGLPPADVRGIAERLQLPVRVDADDAHARKATGLRIAHLT